MIGAIVAPMASMSLGIDTGELDVLRQAFDKAPDMAERELTAFMWSATSHLQAEVIQRTPVAHHTLRNSIQNDVRPLELGIGVEGLVATSLAYAIPVELGSKPHWAPLAPLIDWVEQKLGLEEKEAESMAYAIRGAIARRGTLGVGMFHRTLAANRTQIAEQFSQMVARLAELLRGAQ